MLQHLRNGRSPALCGRVERAGWRFRRVVERQAPRVVAAAASSSSSSEPWSSLNLDINPRELIKRSRQLQELLQETATIAAASGPRGFMRAAQAAEAVASLAAEYLPVMGSGGVLDPPQVLLRKLFERLGATYIKLGQFIASSPSVFPEEYVIEFQRLLDKTEPLPFDSMRRIIESELGVPLDTVFSFVDSQPIASASVAQVYSAVLRASGKEVVIKVLKPGVEEVLSTDLNAIYLASRYLELLSPELGRLSLAPILSDIRSSMMEEVDFTKEASNIAAFAAFLDSSGYRGAATCPFVYRQFSSRRVLVMERLNGVPLTDLAAVRSITAADPEGVLIGALNTWFASVLAADSFHADVHAGNLLVLPDGRVGFIDFGIVGRINPVTWRAMEALIAALALRDYDTMARALATIGACADDVDYSAFARDLDNFFTNLEQVNSSLVVTAGPGGQLSASLDAEQEGVNRLLLAMVRLGEAHGIRFPREFGLFLKQLLYFDRYTRILAPSLRVFNDDRVDWRGATATGAGIGRGPAALQGGYVYG